MKRLHDRIEAGRELARKLTAYSGSKECVVVGLPRGGVPVAAEIARELRLPLDVFMVRKLGVPYQPELAMGAIASGGVRVMNPSVVSDLGISLSEIESVAATEAKELDRREKLYKPPGPSPGFRDKVVIVVDDGVATGATMSAAIAALRKHRVRKVIVAIGVAPPDTIGRLWNEADEVVCVLEPDPLQAISLWYDEFPQVTDDEVRSALSTAHPAAA
ncbi:MAG: phosphoribosyltransferase [Bryobacteraceae bacterium]